MQPDEILKHLKDNPNPTTQLLRNMLMETLEHVVALAESRMVGLESDDELEEEELGGRKSVLSWAEFSQRDDARLSSFISAFSADPAKFVGTMDKLGRLLTDFNGDMLEVMSQEQRNLFVEVHHDIGELWATKQ